MSRPKILSPVTSFKGAVEVISAGADEIYCAVQVPGAVHLLNRPEFCCVPTYHELGQIAEYARSKGVDTIVTLELPFISEFMARQMKEHIASCVGEGIDALIVGDVGLVKLVRDMEVTIPIYASTLLVTMNYEAVDFLRELGIKRIVLERHVSVEEIAEVVHRHQDLEIEVFVHGQGCSNINANCYLEYARASDGAIEKVVSGIKGMVIPCRLPFDIYRLPDCEQKITREPILDAFTFCSLCRLPELIETGVAGLKIVGRCFALAYQVRATKMYRDLVDLIERGQRTGFNRRQRRRFDRMVESFKEEPVQPGSPGPEARSSAPPDPRDILSTPGSLRDILCTEGRCYYSPFFHTPYRAAEPQVRG